MSRRTTPDTTTRYRLEPIDTSFFDTAPYRSSHTLDLPVPAERVWHGLVAHPPLSWCRFLSRTDWTSPPPHGVDSERRVVVGTLLHLRERFISWEEGRHHAFTVDAANLPLFRRFGETCHLEPTPTGCQLTWTFAYELRPAFRAGTPLATALFASLVRDTRRHFR